MLMYLAKQTIRSDFQYFDKLNTGENCIENYLSGRALPKTKCILFEGSLQSKSRPVLKNKNCIKTRQVECFDHREKCIETYFKTSVITFPDIAFGNSICNKLEIVGAISIISYFFAERPC